MEEINLLISPLPATVTIIAVVAAVNVFLGFLVYLKDRFNIVNRVFFGFILAVTFWVAGLLVALSVTDKKLALYGLHLAFAGASLIAPACLHFVTLFPPRLKFRRWIIAAFYAVSLILAGLSLGTDKVVRDLTLLPLGYKAAYGWAYPIFGVFFLGTMCAVLGLIIYKYRRAGAEDKPRLRIFLIGYSISLFFASMTNLIIPAATGASSYSRYGPVALTPFIVLTAYTIIRHNLLNIKVIATELLTFSIGLILFIKLLLSPSWSDFAFNAAIFALLVVFGTFLIRSVWKEVSSREEIAVLAQKLQKSNKELKKLDAAKSEFISIASHQLRAPLTIIKGYVSLVREGTLGKITSQSDQALERVAISTEQLVKLVNDLLDLSRMEAGKLKYEFAPADFIKLAEEVVAGFKSEAAQKGLELEFQNVAGRVPPFKLDSGKIREVITNLVDNAIKYSDAGKILVKIEGENYGGRLWLRLSVADTGIGVKKEDLNRLFIKFNRTPESQKIDPYGMGIGLYFAKRVVEDHGGKVWAESDGIGKGSTFFAELPVR